MLNVRATTNKEELHGAKWYTARHMHCTHCTLGYGKLDLARSVGITMQTVKKRSREASCMHCRAGKSSLYQEGWWHSHLEQLTPGSGSAQYQIRQNNGFSDTPPVRAADTPNKWSWSCNSITIPHYIHLLLFLIEQERKTNQNKKTKTVAYARILYQQIGHISD